MSDKEKRFSDFALCTSLECAEKLVIPQSEFLELLDKADQEYLAGLEEEALRE